LDAVRATQLKRSVGPQYSPSIFMSKENSQSVLGLENNVVRLSDHSSLWADLYREEERRITTAIGRLIADLQHIGSTAIPGIKAKPILDMLAGVAQLENALLCKAPLESFGYDYIARAGIANDYVFGKGLPRTHYLHMVEYGSAKWVNHLYFRDRLRSDPELAQAYERLKEELSRKFSNSHAEYHDAKSKFINKVVAA
jgi:GrpB-like predicted nucleotidyltransferase (UPF0157 family)